MGVLRLFLAVTVLDWHYRFSGSVIFPFSFAAVCCFFVISGFYMSLVINERYHTTPSGLGSFYLNRALRLYPINIVVLGAFIVTGHLGLTKQYGPFVLSQPMPMMDRIATILNQVLIFPHVVWENIRLLPDPSYNNLVFGQFYTVGLEIMFYVLAPLFVTRRLRVLLGLLALSALLHFGMHAFGLPPRPWQYEFFPGVLVFFLLGSVSYRMLRMIREWRYPQGLGYAVLPIFLACCVFAHDATIIDFTNGIESFGLYIVTALGIPFLFQASRNARWDRCIGDLSYPVYAVHFLVGFVMVGDPGTGSMSQNLGVLVVVLLAAIALVVLVEWPVDAVRARIGRSSRAATARPSAGVVQASGA